jgi:hypothetical protein
MLAIITIVAVCTRSLLHKSLVLFVMIFVVSSVGVGFVAMPSAGLSTTVSEAAASNIVFTNGGSAGEQAFVFTIEDTEITNTAELTVDPGTAASAYTTATVDTTVSGPNATAITATTTVTNTGQLQLSVNSTNQTIEKIRITITASNLDVTALQPGDLTDARVGDQPITDASVVYDRQAISHTDGELVYEGQQLQIDNSTTLATGEAIGDVGDGLAGVTRIEIRRLNDDREIGGVETRESVSSTNSGQQYVAIDTTDLDESGEYAIIYQGFSETEATRGDPINNRQTNASLIELSTNDFSTRFETADVLDSETTSVEIDSSRSEYTFAVTAEDLTNDELTRIFGSNKQPAVATALPGQFTSESDGIIITGSDSLTANFTGIDPGSYDFEFNITDTDRTDTASITVSETVVGATWDETLNRVPAGDVATVTLDLEATEQAYVQVGGPEIGFIDFLYVEDSSDDGTVEITINTRLLGAATVPTEAVYQSDDDVVESAFYDGFTQGAPQFQVRTDTSANYSKYAAALGVFDSDPETRPRLDQPAQPGEYKLVVSETPVIGIDDGNPEFESELTRGFLELTSPRIQDVTTRVAPAGAADEYSSAAAARQAGTVQTDIREGDQLIIEFNASGLYGHLAAIQGDPIINLDSLEQGQSASILETLLSRTGEGIELDVKSVSQGPNAIPAELNFDAPPEIVSLYPNPTAGSFVIVVDTGSALAFDGPLKESTEFVGTLSYEVTPDDTFEFSSGYVGGADGKQTEPAYPYPTPGVDHTATTTFNITGPSTSFLTTDNESVALVPDSEYELRGGTNIAPGTEVAVTIRSTDGTTTPFFKRAETRIKSNGSFTASFDLTGQSVGDPAIVTLFTTEDGRIASADATFVEAIELPTQQSPISITAPETVTPGSSVTIEVSSNQTDALQLTELSPAWTVTGIDTGISSSPALTVTLTAPEQAETGTFNITTGGDDPMTESVNITVTESGADTAAPSPQLSGTVTTLEPAPEITGQPTGFPQPVINGSIVD